jgi:Flp pilus assembly protein CpaB
MKSLNTTLILVAFISGLVAAFQAGRLIDKSDASSQKQTAVSPSPVDIEKRQLSAEAIEIAKAIDAEIAAIAAAKHRQEEERPQPEMIEVIVVKKKLLPVGAVLDEKELEDLLGTMKFPKGTVRPDAIVNAEELKNKCLTRTLRQGDYFSPEDVTPDVGLKIPEGMCKYAMRVDNQFSGFIQPGARVDIINTEPLSDGKFKSSVVLRDMLVLAVDVALSKRETSGLSNAACISLAVTSEEALTLASCEKRGDVKLVLRNPGNSAR